MNWYVGDIWEIDATITDPDTGSKVDPSTVTLTVTNPKGETGAPVSMTKTAVGEYNVTTSLTEAGQWHAVINTTGTYQAAKPETITVQTP